MDALPIDIVKLIKICRENDAAMVGLFGSLARGEDTSTSFLNHIPDVIKKMRMKQSRFPKGWDEDRVKRVIDHYENQTKDEAVAENEAAWEDTSHTFIEVPNELIPAVRELLAKNFFLFSIFGFTAA